MDFSRLEKSIMDVIKEEQAKLGYRKEKIRLYYPLSSLNHFFQVEGDVTGMLEKLNWFPEYTKQRLGQVESGSAFISRKREWSMCMSR